MDMKEAARHLNGNEYRREGSPELFAAMKGAGLVAIFGASDDLMEFRGAIYDECGAYEGHEAYLVRSGLLTNDCANDSCPHFKKAKAKAATVEALWNEDESFVWTYRTALPHETFEIMEDGEPYCRGIVVSLSDCPAV